MIEHKSNGISIFQFENLAKFDLIHHFVSSRAGGTSLPPFHSLNMGMHVGDTGHMVLQNRKILSQALGAEPHSFVFANQTHSAHVMHVTAHQKGAGFHDTQSALPDTDAMITNTPELWLCVQVADCVPILLYDQGQNAVASIHAGWRGIVKQIVKHTVEAMMMQFGSDPSHIVAGIGPSNGPCCYEVGEEVASAARLLPECEHGVLLPSVKPGKYFFNQSQAVKQQLISSGLNPNLIEISGLCTQCLDHTFFSSRAGRGVTGRFAAGIMLRKN